jgi:hypothetical protein
MATFERVSKDRMDPKPPPPIVLRPRPVGTETGTLKPKEQ